MLTRVQVLCPKRWLKLSKSARVNAWACGRFFARSNEFLPVRRPEHDALARQQLRLVPVAPLPRVAARLGAEQDPIRTDRGFRQRLRLVRQVKDGLHGLAR